MIEKFVVGNDTIRPKSPYDILIKVDAKTYHSSPFVACEWPTGDKVKISWVKNGERETVEWSVCQTNANQKRISFIFATFEDAKNFTIMLPGVKSIPLDPLEIE